MLPQYLLIFIFFLASCQSRYIKAIDAQSAVFYVSPSGNDKNSGTSPSKPLGTLERAQLAMQNSGANKKISYLMGGVYNIKNTLVLTAKDNGESWLAYHGQTPILDGGGIVEKAISINSDSIKIRWLTIQNFSRVGIYAENSNNILIDSNVIKNITTNGWNQGGIVSFNSFTNSTISHNFVENSGYAGIMSASNEGNDISNLTIDSNEIHNVCHTVNDCGAIYADDRGHVSKNIRIINNVIKNYGGKATPMAWAIYLDDQISNVLVKNNISSGNGGDWAFMIHGGDHNIVRNNIFDISNTGTLGLYSKIGNGAKNYGMEGNVFSCNIIYSSNFPPASLWKMVGSYPKPDTYDNLYWSDKEKMPNSGDIIDRNPTFKNPEFINSDSGKHNFKNSNNLDFCKDFKPINTKHVGPLPNSWRGYFLEIFFKIH